jgi:serine O-acetyltransferase
MGWYADYRADVARYQRIEQRPAAQEVAMHQGLWALLQYRIAAAAQRSSLPPALRLPLIAALYAWRKVIEMTTGICLPPRAQIGPGLYIAHFGQVIVNPAAVIGARCDLHQGVTIAYSDRAGRAGVPVIGDDVWIGPNTTIAGPITVGDYVMISANSLVTRDVPSDSVVRGVPAEVVGTRSKS